MSAMASRITRLTIVYSAVYSGTDQRKHQSSALFELYTFTLEIFRNHYKIISLSVFTWDLIPLNSICPSWGHLAGGSFPGTRQGAWGMWNNVYIPCTMVAWSNENIFCVTGHFCREFTGEFPTQRPVTRSFDVFVDLHLNKRLSKQSCGWGIETPSRPLWRHSNESILDERSLLAYVIWLTLLVILS